MIFATFSYGFEHDICYEFLGVTANVEVRLRSEFGSWPAGSGCGVAAERLGRRRFERLWRSEVRTWVGPVASSTELPQWPLVRDFVLEQMPKRTQIFEFAFRRFFEIQRALEVIQVKIARRRRDRAQSHMSNSLKTRVRKSNQSAPSCRREIRRACQESRRDRTM